MNSKILCPLCKTSLAHLTSLQSSAHVNACLDGKSQQNCNGIISIKPSTALPSSSTVQSDPKDSFDIPTCGVCQLDLSALTPAAREDHANRCADSLLPKKTTVKRRKKRVQKNNARQYEKRKTTTGDPNVVRLLKLLGLDRFASRFAAEEIDLPTLRVLQDHDFVQLKIPESARRRIAEALHSVPILTRIENEKRQETYKATTIPRDGKNDDEKVPTQKFEQSKVGQRRKRIGGPLLELDSSDMEYEPSPEETVVRKNDHHATFHTEVEVCEAIGSNELLYNDPPCEQGNKEKQRNVNGLDDFLLDSAQLSEEPTHSSSESEFLQNGTLILDGLSQIDIETRLRKWRRIKLKEERQRHRAAVMKINEQHQQLLKNGLRNQQTNMRKQNETTSKQNSLSQMLETSPKKIETVSTPDDTTGLQRQGDDIIMLEIETPKTTAEITVSGKTKSPLEEGPKRSQLEKNCDDDHLDQINASQQKKDGNHTQDRTVNFLVPIVISPDTIEKKKFCTNTVADKKDSPNFANDASIVISSGSLRSSPKRPRDDSDDSDFEPLNIRGLGESPETSCLPNDSINIPLNLEREPKLPRLESNDDNDADDDVINLLSAKKPSLHPTESQFPLSENDEEIRNLANQESSLHPTASQYPLSESDEEILNLVNGNKENSRDGVDAMRSLELGGTDSQDVRLDREDFGTQTQTQTVSRLKKRPRKKISREDIAEALKTNASLYDDILSMHTVPFERILECVRGSGVQVSKKGLVDFLHMEGILFRGEVAKKGSAAANFLNHVRPNEY